MKSKVKALKKMLSLPEANKKLWDLVESEKQVTLFVYNLDFAFECINNLAGLGSIFNVTYPENLSGVSKEDFIEISITNLPKEILLWL
ncbi:hypothetical protein LFYK43_00510 [Ligilactobacillus salitolerans]|uniref:Uncharacterized protein n=1 Tax=Ligilactobacillus salitolerans TaxID=1808352 RepID=A0A401IPY6_9LACO|nr:hypothetical protein [Ligilactobacillus salitolerans]GBG93592.1 hypothetical protein LFYK43_00510 [Ligilactobacillus salitolerans]